MIWIFGAVLLVAAYLLMGYRNEMRLIEVEIRRLASEIGHLWSQYQAATMDERPAIQISYFLGFSCGYMQMSLQELGLKPKTIRAHNLLPRTLTESGVGQRDDETSTGERLWLQMDSLALARDGAYIQGAEHGIMVVALANNKLKTEIVSSNLVQGAFQLARNRGHSHCYKKIANALTEILFDSFAPKGRRFVSMRAAQDEAGGCSFPF